jgi:hypothetical protein
MSSTTAIRLLARGLALSLLLLGSSLHAQYTPYTNTLNGRQFSNVYAAHADFLISQSIQRGSFQMRAQGVQEANRNAAQGQPIRLPSQITAAPPRGWNHAISTTDFSASGDRERVPAEMADAAGLRGAARDQWIDAALTLQQAVEAMPDFRRNNLSYAMTLALGVAIQVRYGGDIGDAAEEALLRSINDALGEAEGWREMSAVELTRAYDTMVITGGLMAGLAEQSDPEMRGMARDMADSTLRAFGLTP